MREERGIKLNYASGVILEFFLVLLVVLFTLLRFGRGVSIAFDLTFLVLIPMVVQYITAREIPKVLLLLVLFTLFSVIVNALLSSVAAISFSYFYKMIMFLCTMVLFWSASEASVGEKTKRLLRLLPVLMGLMMAISYYLLGNRAMIAHSITLGFVNPNFTGMWLTHVFFYVVCFFVSEKKLILRFLSVVLAVLCLILIWKTYARSCFAGLLLFMSLMVVGIFRGFKKLPTVILLLIVLSPLAFALFYLYVVHADWFSHLFRFLIRTGKAITARDMIWRIAFRQFRIHPVFGNYAGISNGSGVSQLHNTHIDVLCSYGMVPFLLFLSSLLSIIKRVNERIAEVGQYTALCAFLGVIVIGSFEASIVAGSTGLYLLSGGFLILTSADVDLASLSTKLDSVSEGALRK